MPTTPFPDSEEIDALQCRLTIHRRNLYRLEEQKAKYGFDVPLRILNEIAEQEEAIAQIEARRAEREIADLRSQLAEYQAEYRELGCE